MQTLPVPMSSMLTLLMSTLPMLPPPLRTLNHKGNGACHQDVLEAQPPAQFEAATAAREDRGRRGCCRAEGGLRSQRGDGHGRLTLTLARLWHGFGRRRGDAAFSCDYSSVSEVLLRSRPMGCIRLGGLVDCSGGCRSVGIWWMVSIGRVTGGCSSY